MRTSSAAAASIILIDTVLAFSVFFQPVSGSVLCIPDAVNKFVKGRILRSADRREEMHTSAIYTPFQCYDKCKRTNGCTAVTFIYKLMRQPKLKCLLLFGPIRRYFEDCNETLCLISAYVREQKIFKKRQDYEYGTYYY